MKKAYLYARFSSKRQELGNSLERQIKRAEEYCNRNNLDLSTQTFEDLGVSAYKNKARPGLEALLDCIKQNTIPSDSFVLLENTDRLSRKGFKHALDLMEQLVSTGVTIAMVDTGQVYTQANIQQLATALPLLLDADRAKAESDRKASLIKAAKAKTRINHTIKGKQPFWIDLKDGKPVLNEKAVIAEKMIQYRLEGCSAQRVARLLNEQGYKSPTGKDIGAALVKITTSNHAIYGAKQYGEVIDDKLVPIEIVDDLYPPLCSRATFLQIQYNKGKSNSGGSKTGTFTKLFKCPECDSALTSRSSKINGKYYVYRRCIGNLEGRCKNGTAYRDVDSIVKGQIKHLTYVNKTTHSTDNKLLELEAKLAVLEQTKALISDPVALASIYTDISKVQADINTAKDEMVYIKNTDVDFKYIADLKDPIQQNTLLRRVIEKIVPEKPNRKTIKVTVYFKNKHRITFSAILGRGDKPHKVMFKSDTEQFGKWLKELTKD